MKLTRRGQDDEQGSGLYITGDQQAQVLGACSSVTLLGAMTCSCHTCWSRGTSLLNSHPYLPASIGSVLKEGLGGVLPTEWQW